MNQSIIECGTENGVQSVSQTRGPLTRCPSEVAVACSDRLCCVLPPQALHHRVFSAMAAANTKELATQHENGGIRPTNHSTFSQVHTCRGIWAVSDHMVALPQLHGVRTCTAAVCAGPRLAIRWPAKNFVQGCAGWLLIRYFSGIPQRPCPRGQACARGPRASRTLENSLSSDSEDARGSVTPPEQA